MARLPGELQPKGTVQHLRETMLARHRCLLLGGFLADGERTTSWLAGLKPLLHPPPHQPFPTIRGIVAIADRWEALEAAVFELAGGEPPAEAHAPARPIPVSLVPVVPVARVLVLGFNEDTVETVGELLRLFPGAEVTVVGDDEETRRRMRDAFIGERTETMAQFVETGPKSLALHQSDGRVVGSVFVRVADRLHDGLYRRATVQSPVGTVFDYDAVMLLSERGGQTRGDPDAATVLGVLKLLDYAAQSPDAVGRLRHVVVELSDRTKHELLRSRARGRCALRFSFVCTSELREDFLCHAFFVPGLSPVLHDLLTAGGHEIVAVRPDATTGTVTFLELVRALGARAQPLVPLAIVTASGEIHTNPPPEAPIALADVSLVYCLADMG